MEYARPLGHHQKTKLQIMGIEEGEEIQAKGIDNLFNNIIAENFPNLEKGKDIENRRLSECQTGRVRKAETLDILKLKH
jgi:hypothetical protein